MRVAWLDAAHKIVLRDEPKPSPGPGEALVRIGACGVCGSDVHWYHEGHIGETRITSPFIIGHEFGGVVEAVGSKDDERLLGLKVAVEPAMSCMRCHACLSGSPNCCTAMRFCGSPPVHGAYQDYIVMPARNCEVVPQSFTHSQIAMLEPLAIGVHVIDLAKPKLGSSAAILGAGTIGRVILECAKGLHLDPLIVTDRYDYRLQAAKAAGATHVINIDKDDSAQAVLDLTHGHGVDYVFEATDNDQAPGQGVLMAAHTGKCFFVGIYESDQVMFANSHARHKGLTIYIVRLSRRALPRAIELLAHNAVDVDSIVTHNFTLENLSAALETVLHRKDGVIKAMVKVGDD